MIFRRSRFADVVDAQLGVFLQDHREAVDEVEARLSDYNRGERGDAEELYGDYVDAVDAACDILAGMRDEYARTVEDPDAYVRAFNRAVARRLPELSAGVEAR